MDLKFNVSEERQQVWIERLKNLIQEHESMLEEESKGFAEIEQEYFKWKGRIDRLKSTISADKSDLETFAQASRLEKPLVRVKVKEGLKKFNGHNGEEKWKSSGIIRWEPMINQCLREIGHFVFHKELWKYLVAHNLVDDTMINHKRYYVAASSKANTWRVHDGPTGIKKIGLKEWFEDDAPKV